jgi:hypothetical protein
VKAWDGKAPIALVPTAYPQMTVRGCASSEDRVC